MSRTDFDVMKASYGGYEYDVDKAWKIGKPVLSYSDYVVRRIIARDGLKGAFLTLVNQRYSDRIWGECPNRFLGVSMCVPLAIIIHEKRRNGLDFDNLWIHSVTHYIRKGGIAWKGHLDYEEGSGIKVNMDTDLPQIAATFIYNEFLERTLPELQRQQDTEDPDGIRKDLNRPLDVSNKLGFRWFVYKWKKLARKITIR